MFPDAVEIAFSLTAIISPFFRWVEVTLIISET
jgi:hypothetical protein